jgi:hypothetical protein
MGLRTSGDVCPLISETSKRASYEPWSHPHLFGIIRIEEGCSYGLLVRDVCGESCTENDIAAEPNERNIYIFGDALSSGLLAPRELQVSCRPGKQTINGMAPLSSASRMKGRNRAVDCARLG